MDPRERYEDHVEAFNAGWDGRQAELWTALPAVVQSYSPTENTVSLQPTIQAQVSAKDGTTSWVNLPILIHCPVFFPSGGGYTLTFPIAAGDEGLVIFASRCIDAWWQLSGINPQVELRMHDLSDGFFLPKFWSKPKVISNISTASAQLRSDDGQCYIELAASHAINIITPGNLTSNVQGTTSVISKGNVKVTCSNGSVDLTDKAGSVVNMNGDGTGTMIFSGGLTINANVTINGNEQVNGSIGYTGGMTGSGGANGIVANLNGNVNVTGQTTTGTLNVT